MSKNISSRPTSSRAKKITGGRVRYAVYFPLEESKAIEAAAEQTGMSTSSIITNTYFAGKQISN